MASALSAVPVVAIGTVVGHAVALADNLVPCVAWQAVGVHLDASAGANVESPLDGWISSLCSTIFRVSRTVEGSAQTLAPEFVPVCRSVINVVASFGSTSAFASRLVPLLANAAFLRKAGATTVFFRPELARWAVSWGANAAAGVLVPNGTVGANHWAALALAVLVVPDHHVTAGVGLAEACALRVIPELVRGARGIGHTDPGTFLSRPVGMNSIFRGAVVVCTFAGARFSIIILVLSAKGAVRVTDACASLHVPILVRVAAVTLLVALALAGIHIPLEPIVAVHG